MTETSPEFFKGSFGHFVIEDVLRGLFSYFYPTETSPEFLLHRDRIKSVKEKHHVHYMDTYALFFLIEPVSNWRS